MKIYIKNSTVFEPITYHIEIDVYINNPYAIMSSSNDDTVDPIVRKDGTVDRRALEKWELFVQRIALRIKPILKVVDIEKSTPDKSLTSRYFWVFGRNESGTINVEIVLRLRLSDHDYPPSHSKDGEYNYVNDNAHKYTPPDKFGTQFADVDEIIVRSKELGQDNSYDTYTQAVDAVYKIMLKIRDEFFGGNVEPHFDWSEDAEYQLTQFTDEEIKQFEDSYKKSH